MGMILYYTFSAAKKQEKRRTAEIKSEAACGNFFSTGQDCGIVVILGVSEESYTAQREFDFRVGTI